MIRVPNRPDLRVALLIDSSNFSRRQLDQRVAAFAVCQRGVGARAADHLRPSARGHLHVMHGSPQGDCLERKRVAYGGIGILAGAELRPHREADR
jgi:hypothetical protein